MKIGLVLEVLNPDDIDPADYTGLTLKAYDRLMGAIEDAGFSVDAGPKRADRE